MESNERKEIVQFSGLTILVVLALVANFLIVGFVYRWHQWKLFTLEKTQQVKHTELLKKEHDVKGEVTQLEGASAWDKTAYAETYRESGR